MTLQIDQNSYDEFFKGFHITDCAVRDRNIFYFVLRAIYSGDNAPPEHELKKRFVQFVQNHPTVKPWGYKQLNGFGRLKAGASLMPFPHFVGVSSEGGVFAFGKGLNEIEDDLRSWAEGGPQRGGIRKLRTIEGALYAVGGNRTVLRRDGKNNWHGFTKEIPSIGDSDQGFEDMDGFSAKDIYCVGGTGNVFHFDGTRWQQCAFPSNRYLESVCCAGDGYVYIGGQSGYVFKGRGEQWKKIHQDNMTLGFTDMVWHQGKVWCTSDYGLWVIENDKLVEADVPPEIRACSGNLSVGDGVMLLAGMFGAAYHDGQQWHMLVNTQTMA